MKISVVIPNFNGEKLLANNLPKVIEAVGDAEIIVVDDASTDQSVKLLKEKFPRVIVIEKKKNRGFASTINTGVQKASSDFVLLLNSDVVPEKAFLAPVMPHFKDENVFAVGCLQIGREWKGGVIHGSGIGKFEHGFLIHGPGDPQKAHTLWVFGGAGVFRKIIWEKLGGLCVLFDPFYWEDIDLSYRAQKSGYKIFFEPKSIVHHEQGVTIHKKYSAYEIKAIAYRNQLYFVWLNISYWKYILDHIVFTPIHLFKAVISADFSYIKGFILAILSFNQVLAQRRRNSRLWRKDDREFF